MRTATDMARNWTERPYSTPYILMCLHLERQLTRELTCCNRKVITSASNTNCHQPASNIQVLSLLPKQIPMSDGSLRDFASIEHYFGHIEPPSRCM